MGVLSGGVKGKSFVVVCLACGRQRLTRETKDGLTASRCPVCGHDRWVLLEDLGGEAALEGPSPTDG